MLNLIYLFKKLAFIFIDILFLVFIYLWPNVYYFLPSNFGHSCSSFSCFIKTKCSYTEFLSFLWLHWVTAVFNMDLMLWTLGIPTFCSATWPPKFLFISKIYIMFYSGAHLMSSYSYMILYSVVDTYEYFLTLFV